MLTRDEVIQTYLNLFPAPGYLEIGVSQGTTFHALKAARKVAVDPRFEIEYGEREVGSTYLELTSDEYFSKLEVDAGLFNVIYLDGLHTLEQTLRDLMNAIDFLHRDGVIIIDDVMPNSYAASLRDYRDTVAVRQAIKETLESWMGDTYRLVFFIQSFLLRFDYATVSDNHGQLVMWRGNRSLEQVVERKLEDIARLEFRHIVAERPAFNLLPNEEIMHRVRKAHDQRR